MGQSGDESQSTQANIPRPTGAFGMKTISFDLVDAAGNPIPRMDVHLHHVLLMNTVRTSLHCSNWPERFAGAGSERTPTSLPDPYAYLVGANDRWNALWDGYLIGSGGHLHAGGISVTIRNDTAGTECTMTARYDEEVAMGAPSSITTCPVHEPFRAGQTVRVTSRYDNSEPRQDVMGIVLAWAWRGTQ